jgi:hypothetical protein
MGEPPVDNGAFEGLAALVDELQRAGKQVVFLIDNPAIGDSKYCVPRSTAFFALDALLARSDGHTCDLRYDQYASAISPYLDRVAKLKADHPGLTIYYLAVRRGQERLPNVPRWEVALQLFGPHFELRRRPHCGGLAACDPIPFAVQRGRRSTRILSCVNKMTSGHSDCDSTRWRLVRAKKSDDEGTVCFVCWQQDGDYGKGYCRRMPCHLM